MTTGLPGADTLSRALETLALDFENSVHHVWDNQEVADRIREVAADIIAAFPSPAATANVWQPIETAPKDGTAVLLTDARVVDWTQVAAWEADRNSPWAWGRDDCDTYWHEQMFTHWQPLPAPPAITDKRPPMQEEGK